MRQNESKENLIRLIQIKTQRPPSHLPLTHFWWSDHNRIALDHFKSNVIALWLPRPHMEVVRYHGNWPHSAKVSMLICFIIRIWQLIYNKIIKIHPLMIWLQYRIEIRWWIKLHRYRCAKRKKRSVATSVLSRLKCEQQRANDQVTWLYNQYPINYSTGLHLESLVSIPKSELMSIPVYPNARKL